MGEKKRIQTGSPTVTDVAQRAGVSRAAVSYVLNEDRGQRNKHVSAEARERILRSVQELHFRPLASARALRKGYSEELAVVLDHTYYPVVTEFVTAVQQHALAHGFTPVMYFCQGLSHEERQKLYRTIFARRPLCIITSARDFTEQEIALARNMGVEHVVFYGFHHRSVEGTHSVIIPSRALGSLAARHLVERGHRRLALVQPDDPIQEEGFLQRLEGMREVLADVPDATLQYLPLKLSATAARTLVETISDGALGPTGIYAFSDEYAVVLLSALARHGVRVPQDVAIIGTDNLPLCEFVWPSLTTIDVDIAEIGKRVVETVSLRRQGSAMPDALAYPLVPRLIQREST